MTGGVVIRSFQDATEPPNTVLRDGEENIRQAGPTAELHTGYMIGRVHSLDGPKRMRKETVRTKGKSFQRSHLGALEKTTTL